jgi:enoyl-CoA hydratase
MFNYARDHSVADSLRRTAALQTGMFQPTDSMESFALGWKGEGPSASTFGRFIECSDPG